MGPQDEIRQRAAYEARQMWKIGQILSGEPAPEPDFDPGPKAEVVSASAIAPRPTEWLWPGRVPLGMLTLFSGDPALGKSLAALALIAAVTRGGVLPGGDAERPARAPRGSAILLSGEDDWARTIIPRLRAAGADLERVKTIPTMREPEFRGYGGGPTAHVPACVRPPTASAVDLRAIERAAAELGDCRLIVFDPISAYIGRSADVRRALEPLREMAERLGATVVLITHHNKRGGSGTNGKYRVLGDIAYVGVCRASFLFLADPDDPGGRRRLMLDNGGNLAPRQPGLSYVVHEADEGVARVEWLPETVELDADAALARAVKAGKTAASGIGARRRECEQWLRGFLAAGPRAARDCERAAMEAGFTDSILRRAREDVAVRCVRLGFGKGGCSHWCLPGTAIEEPEHLDPALGVHTCQARDLTSMPSMPSMPGRGGEPEPPDPALGVHTCQARDLTSMPSMPSMPGMGGPPADPPQAGTAAVGDEVA